MARAKGLGLRHHPRIFIGRRGLHDHPHLDAEVLRIAPCPGDRGPQRIDRPCKLGLVEVGGRGKLEPVGQPSRSVDRQRRWNRTLGHLTRAEPDRDHSRRSRTDPGLVKLKEPTVVIDSSLGPQPAQNLDLLLEPRPSGARINTQRLALPGVPGDRCRDPQSVTAQIGNLGGQLGGEHGRVERKQHHRRVDLDSVRTGRHERGQRERLTPRLIEGEHRPRKHGVDGRADVLRKADVVVAKFLDRLHEIADLRW